MKNLPDILKKEKYNKIKFKVSKTQHLLIKATINGVKGNFILDTGASSSCIDFENIKLFEIKATKSKTKASSAGATGMHTQIAKGNTVKIGLWKINNFEIIIIDLSHVNQALKRHKTKLIHGIIGADILQYGKGIIDYYNHCLCLKNESNPTE